MRSHVSAPTATWIQRLVEDMHLYMLLSMNPDGFAKSQRGNARGKDLNRDFPDQWESGLGVHDPNLSRRQPETAALMRWCEVFGIVFYGMEMGRLGAYFDESRR